MFFVQLVLKKIWLIHQFGKAYLVTQLIIKRHFFFRFGIGRFTTEAEVDFTIEKTVEHVNRLREMRSVNPKLS